MNESTTQLTTSQFSPRATLAAIGLKLRQLDLLGLDADYRHAIELLEQVQHERPDAAVVYSKLGWAYMLEGNTRQALSYYNQALMLDAGDLLSLFELGKYYWIIGERSRARGYFERVRQHDRTGEYTQRLREILGESQT